MSSEIKYAGFFVRLIAFIIDMFIMSIPYKVLDHLLDIDMNLGIPMLITWWIYASYSIYRWKGTIGNKIVGIAVLDMDIKQLSFNKSILRSAYILLEFIYVFYVFTFLGSLPDEYGLIVLFLPLLIFAPIYILFFNKYRQFLHDYLAKCVVVDKIDDVEVKDNLVELQNKSINKLSTIRKIFRFIAIVAILIPVAYGIFYFTVMYMAFGGRGKTSNNPTTSISKTVDYNNTKIDFYKSELEKANAEFIEAESMYEILYGRVKKDLSSNCIRFFLQKEGHDDWLKEGRTYETNARNKYANTVERVKKAKKNEEYMGHHFYDFDLNEVNHIEEETADMWDANANKETCEKMLSSDKMYDIFIVKYIKNREATKSRYTFDLTREKDRSQRRFLKRSIDQISSWLDELYANHPEYLEAKKKREIALNIEYQKMKQEEAVEKERNKLREKERQEKLYQEAFQKSKQPIFIAIRFKKNSEFDSLMLPGTDLEMKDEQGYTLLRVAIYYKNEYAINRLLKSGANMYTIDEYGLYTPFTHATLMNDIKTVKLFLENGVDVNYQYKKSETALTMSAKGCKNFEMVQLLLDHGANPDLIDTYNKSTRTGLSRYCRDKEKYNKMMKLIEKKSSFFSRFF
jgi:uncharacterized RDD family membrane protein YckC